MQVYVFVQVLQLDGHEPMFCETLNPQTRVKIVTTALKLEILLDISSGYRILYI